MLAETGSAWHREVQSFLDQFHDRVACALLDVRELEPGGTEEMSVGVHILNTCFDQIIKISRNQYEYVDPRQVLAS